MRQFRTMLLCVAAVLLISVICRAADNDVAPLRLAIAKLQVATTGGISRSTLRDLQIEIGAQAKITKIENPDAADEVRMLVLYLDLAYNLWALNLNPNHDPLAQMLISVRDAANRAGAALAR